MREAGVAAQCELDLVLGAEDETAGWTQARAEHRPAGPTEQQFQQPSRTGTGGDATPTQLDFRSTWK